jgi:GNAT superfamily N-acetyltransferase
MDTGFEAMNALTFLPADISDIPTILNLVSRSKSHFHPGKEQYVKDFVEIWGPRAYYVEDHILLKALRHEDLIGVIGMRAPTLKRTAELDLLFIDSPYIGQGYGGLLWNQTLKIAQEHSWSSFRFLSDKLSEIVGFYEHMGARQMGSVSLEAGDFPLMEYGFESD